MKPLTVCTPSCRIQGRFSCVHPNMTTSFDFVWAKHGKTRYNTIPKSKLNIALADLETTVIQGKDKVFNSSIVDTLSPCASSVIILDVTRILMASLRMQLHPSLRC